MKKSRSKKTDHGSKDAPLCFVAMPSGGNDASAKRLYDGWYMDVVAPAIEAAGFKPFLIVSEPAPVKITDDIRRHLVEDPMALFDLGGLTEDASPNANVMYELGIRHACDKPSVLYAWSAVRLPFDIGEQQAIIAPRDVGAAKMVREAIAAHIRAAAQGRYYKPMEAVARHELIASAAGRDDGIAAIAAELSTVNQTVRELSKAIADLRTGDQTRSGVSAAIQTRRLGDYTGPISSEAFGTIGQHLGRTLGDLTAAGIGLDPRTNLAVGSIQDLYRTPSREEDR